MKENRTNPLDQIEFWFTALPLEKQKTLASTANHYHIDYDIYCSKGEEKLTKFLSYLDSSELNDREILSRTLFVTRLIDFSFAGKRTEDDWEVHLNRMIALKNHCQELGQSTEMEDNAIANWETDKAQWLEIVASWENFVVSEIPDKEIVEWYFEPAFKKKF